MQRNAQRALEVGDYDAAEAAYDQLDSIVYSLEAMGATGLPPGMALQLLQRGKERLQECRGAINI